MTIEIPDISTMDIPDLPEYLTSSPPQAIPPVAPVTNFIGTPVINIPGCVEAHEGGTDSIMKDDPDGVRVYCDANTPSFNPIQYEPENMTIERSTPVPVVRPPETPETPKVPDTGKASPPQTATVEQIEPEPSFVEEYLPTTPEVTTTATIAAVAATSALLAKPIADLMLKVVKPAVKTAIKKISKILGKHEVHPSTSERMKIQREKAKSKDLLKKLLK